MKKKIILNIIFTLICCTVIKAQLKEVVIDTFYIADEFDANDPLAGSIDIGAISYRIYAVLEPNSRVTKIYGDENHLLAFSSTKEFFNHDAFDSDFGKDNFGTLLSNGITLLDSYITIGQVSRNSNDGLFYGSLKEDDFDGSILANSANSFLNNDDPKLGITLINSDGMVKVEDQLETWFSSGFTDAVTGEKLSIFSNAFINNNFESNSAFLSNTGDTSYTNENNIVLLAQLTTSGDLSFIINIEVEHIEEGELISKKYVGTNEIILNDEEYNPLLSFPYECGCKDPNYLEADLTFACEDNSKCLNKVVLGCMDPNACNYNSDANFNVEELCCYIGYCNDLDISLVCPDLDARTDLSKLSFDIVPNPTFNNILVRGDNIQPYINFNYSIINALNIVVKKGRLNKNSSIDVSQLDAGFYFLNIYSPKLSHTKQFIKI